MRLNVHFSILASYHRCNAVESKLVIKGETEEAWTVFPVITGANTTHYHDLYKSFLFYFISFFLRNVLNAATTCFRSPFLCRCDACVLLFSFGLLFRCDLPFECVFNRCEWFPVSPFFSLFTHHPLVTFPNPLFYQSHSTFSLQAKYVPFPLVPIPIPDLLLVSYLVSSIR